MTHLSEYHYGAHKYESEDPDALKSRESILSKQWLELDSLAEGKRTAIHDNLIRNRFRDGVLENISLLNSSFEEYKIRETKAAEHELNIFEVEDGDMIDASKGIKKIIEELCEKILSARYESEFAIWVFEKPLQIRHIALKVAEMWGDLNQVAAEKKLVLEDDLEREKFADTWRSYANSHCDEYIAISEWMKRSKLYLEKKEVIKNSKDARHYLAVLNAFSIEMEGVQTSSVLSMNKLGSQVKMARYDTNVAKRWDGGNGTTHWEYEHPEEILEREQDVERMMLELKRLRDAKKGVLDDDLAREIYAAETRLL
eukprot:UC4_evm1s60